MATVSNIALSIPTPSSASTRNVTVSGTMTFDATEVGKSYRLAIELFGEDKAGDKLPSTDAIGDNLVYTFKWGTVVQAPYKTVPVTAAGSQAFSETRAVSNVKLDEDSGTIPKEIALGTWIQFPRQDEVYAKVSLSGAPVSARSATEIANVGA